ncbi:MAG: hypothetical protein RL272_40 [Candidatus Parcubacteria bacterium]|jgi:hypothetical protein
MTAEKKPSHGRLRSAGILQILIFFAPMVLMSVAGVVWYKIRPATPKSIDASFSIDAAKKVAPKTAAVGFTDVTQQAGISYLQNTPELMKSSECGSACMAMMMSGGGAAGDYDGDGNIDLVVTRMHMPPILYRNKGDGTFEDKTADAGLDGVKNMNGAGWADIDNDGDEDLYFTAIDDTRFFLFVNDGRGRFKEEGSKRGADARGSERHQGYSIAFGDYDRDGFVDILTSQWGFDLWTSNFRLLHNRGAAKPGYFEDVTAKAGFATRNDYVWTSLGKLEASLAVVNVGRAEAAGKIPHEEAAHAMYYDGWFDQIVPNDQKVYSGQFSFAPAFVDLDGDGWQDIAVASDFGTSRLFWNGHDGRFADGTAAARISGEEHGMGSTFGDYDGDGRLDWFVTSIGLPENVCKKEEHDVDCVINSGNRLYRNLGDRTFEDVTDKAGVRQGYWGWGAAFFDYDNDGDQDLAMTNGMNTKKRFKDDPFRFWENAGKDAPMVEESTMVGLEDRGSGKGLLTFDYDNDGDLDLFIVNDNAPPRLMRNDGGNKNAWLKVKVRGTRSNRDGLGAIVELREAAGAPAQVREIGAATHFLGQSELTASFGLGASDKPVKEVMIRWPASGKVQTFTDVPARTILEAVEPE